MKIITCASYYGTGSSAITDFVSEFDNVYSCTNMEFRFIQDPDGISELEYNLVENFNRHNSGHALKRYKRLVDFYSGNIFGKKLSSIFGDNWKTISYKYIDDLTDFSFPGWWMYDLYDRGNWFYFRKRIINKILTKTVWNNRPDRVFNNMKNEMTLCSHPSEKEFLTKTQNYLHELFDCILPEGNDTIVVDQLLPPTNLKRHLRYFSDEVKVVIVDRDPRDLFVLDKYVWKDGIIPNDVETFCKWFKYTRAHRKYDDLETEQICFVRFEDLIYKYESETQSLMRWLGLLSKNHNRPQKEFDPNKSIQNTQVWKKYQQAEEEVKYIEQALEEYLYQFPDGQ